jgi:ketosteroid isomerase-like protein
MIDKTFAEHFAHEWIAAWNSHDLQRILSHYAEDFEMASPFIVQVAGEPSGRCITKDAGDGRRGIPFRRRPFCCQGCRPL